MDSISFPSDRFITEIAEFSGPRSGNLYFDQVVPVTVISHRVWETGTCEEVPDPEGPGFGFHTLSFSVPTPFRRGS